MLEHFSSGQVILINKPRTWTSFDAVRKVKGLIQKAIRSQPAGQVGSTLASPVGSVEKVPSNGELRAPNLKKIKLKIGHAGTLDPLASGLLVICTGRLTKKIEEIVGAEKEYTGTFTLGGTTESYDMERSVNEIFSTAHITPEMIREAAIKFTGEQLQVPPAHSAVKVDGKRAYKLARKGKEVKILPKTVVIKEFEITGIEMPQVHFKVVCGKGTYIRSLARDFGLFLGSGAYLTALCRTRIGGFRLENALSPDEFEQQLAGGVHDA